MLSRLLIGPRSHSVRTLTTCALMMDDHLVLLIRKINNQIKPFYPCNTNLQRPSQPCLNLLFDIFNDVNGTEIGDRRAMYYRVLFLKNCKSLRRFSSYTDHINKPQTYTRREKCRKLLKEDYHTSGYHGKELFAQRRVPSVVSLLSVTRK